MISLSGYHFNSKEEVDEYLFLAAWNNETKNYAPLWGELFVFDNKLMVKAIGAIKQRKE